MKRFSHFYFPAVFFAFGLIIMYLLTAFWLKPNEVVIPVEYDVHVKVEEIIWKGSFSVQGSDFDEVNVRLQKNRDRISRNFTARGLSPEEMFFRIESLNSLDSLNKSFTLTAFFEIKSKNIALVHRIMENLSDFTRFGIEIQTDQPTYLLDKRQHWMIPALKALVLKGKTMISSMNSYPYSSIELSKFSLEEFDANEYAPCGFFSANFTSDMKDSIIINLKAKVLYQFK